MLHRTLILAAMLCLGLCASAQGGIILEIGSTTIAAGGQASVPVYVYSDQVDPATDAFAHFGLTVQITGATAAVGFTGPQPNPDPAFARTDYIYFDNSTMQSMGGTILGFVDGFQVAGGDSSLDGSNVSPGNASEKRLLSILDLKASVHATAGEVFHLDVVADQTEDSPTWFRTDDFSWRAMGSNHSGVVTVTAAVPEPSTLVMMGSLLATFGAAAWWRRRRPAGRG